MHKQSFIKAFLIQLRNIRQVKFISLKRGLIRSDVKFLWFELAMYFFLKIIYTLTILWLKIHSSYYGVLIFRKKNFCQENFNVHYQLTY